MDSKVVSLDISKPGKAFVLPEEELEEKMNMEVIPYLRSHVKEGYMEELHYELYPGTVGNVQRNTIVISFGFTESCVKYYEMIYYFLLQGYQVAIHDHRGHGKSLREVEDHSVIHVEHFDQYVQDFNKFIHTVVMPWAGDSPLFLYAHSMGGCIGARYLECYPGVFTKAVLTAPMLGIDAGGYPSFFATLLSNFNVLIGRGKKRVFTQKVYRPNEPFSHSNGSSEARHNYYRSIRRREVLYQTNAASYRWLMEALRSCRKAIRAGEAQKITIPLLLFQVVGDLVVTPNEQKIFVERVPNARMITVTDTRHEIYRAGNQVLSNYLDELYAFFN